MITGMDGGQTFFWPSMKLLQKGRSFQRVAIMRFVIGEAMATSSS